MLFRIAVVGLGRIGLPFAVFVASQGFDVYGFEVDESKVDAVNKGWSPIYEPGMKELLVKVVNEGRLRAGTEIEPLIDRDIIFVFVGTPTREDGSQDLGQLTSACRAVGKALKLSNKYQLVVIRSTVLPGTTERMVKPILEEVSGKICGKDFGLAMNPEFSREGRALHDFANPSRIVIGEYDKKSGDILEQFYRELYKERMPPLIRTKIVNAELIKYAANAFLAMKISFINLIAQIAQRIPGADVVEIADGIGLDPRIGRAHLNAGLGFGGYCLPKDLRALISFAKSLGVDTKLFESVLEINDRQIMEAIELIRKGIGDVRDKNVCVLGLAFKSDTDDVRESQAIKLVKRLLELGANVRVHDPRAIENAKKVLGYHPRLVYCNNVEQCASGADAIVVATEWRDYRELDLDKLRTTVAKPIIVDCRRIIDKRKAEEHGFRYLGIGLGITND